MAIKHTFVSAISDGEDTSLVRPSNWNDEHTIEQKSITNSHISSGSSVSGDVLVSLGSGSAVWKANEPDILMIQIFS